MRREAFGDFDGRAWLNCAHQGPLPLAAAEAGREAIDWKVSPGRLTQERFDGVPRRLRELLGRLIGVPAEEVILGNGASRGLHLLANGLPLASGDEVLLMGGDFPSDLLPWLALRKRGAEVRCETPADHVFSVDEVRALVSPRTRVLCLPWVHSFSGAVIDLAGVGSLCRERGITFIANVTQGLGALELDLPALPVDAVTCAGWKWLCGPYATGFCWIRPEIRNSLTHNQAYWLATLTAEDLGRADLDPRPPEADNPRRYDIFSPANFFNYVPWAESLELLLDTGPEAIAAHDRALVDRLLDGLDRESFEVLSPEVPERRSTLIFVSHRERNRNQEIHRHLDRAGIDLSFRRGSLRFSPHFYNTDDDIDRALAALGEASS